MVCNHAGRPSSEYVFFCVFQLLMEISTLVICSAISYKEEIFYLFSCTPNCRKRLYSKRQAFSSRVGITANRRRKVSHFTVALGNIFYPFSLDPNY